MSKYKNASIYSIAKIIGVSHNTVALALKNSDRVRPELRQKIHKIAQEVGYRPNFSAQSLVTGKSMLLGVLIRGVDYSYTPKLLQAIQDEATNQNYGLLYLSHGNNPSKIEQHLNFFIDRRIDGLIVFPPAPAPDISTWDSIVNHQIPATFISYQEEIFPGHHVVLCPQEAGEVSTYKTINAGHVNLGYIGTEGNYFSERRKEGLLMTCKQNGLPTPILWNTHNSFSGGAEAAKLWLSAKQKPTAIQCFTDAIAVGFLHALLRNKISVPEEVSIIGTDDLPFAEAAAIPLTTLRPPAEIMGKEAVKILLENSNKDQYTTKKMEWQWIERESFRAIDLSTNSV